MTKRLPDFNTSSIWTELREKMGATDTVELPALGIDQISFEEIHKLQTGSLDIENIKDHINPLDGTFDYKGQKVILYRVIQNDRDEVLQRLFPKLVLDYFLEKLQYLASLDPDIVLRVIACHRSLPFVLFETVAIYSRCVFQVNDAL